MTQRSVPTQDILKRIQGVLEQLGIDNHLAAKTLIVALVTGILAALLDRIFELPTRNFLFTFNGFLVALNGASYAFFKNKDDVAGAIMAAVAGFVALLLWYIVTKIIGERGDIYKYNPADAYNLGKVLLDGVIVGLIGFGWFAGLRRLPAKFLP